jgi:hypothetical protein
MYVFHVLEKKSRRTWIIVSHLGLLTNRKQLPYVSLALCENIFSNNNLCQIPYIIPSVTVTDQESYKSNNGVLGPEEDNGGDESNENHGD